MANGQKFFDEINGYQLRPELLMAALDAISELDRDDRNTLEGQMITIIRVIHERDDLPDEERTHAGMAISFRLRALAKLDLLPLPEWRVVAGREGDPDLLHENVVHCAATEPLVREGEDWSFDRERFMERLASMAPLSMESRLRRTVAGMKRG